APRKGCRCLVLSPTRELATQIADSFKAYGAELGMTVATIFGGVAHNPQRQALNRGVDVIVAAPGRLLDHLGEKDANLSGVEIFVLDEADQMLDMGFIVPIRQIIKHLPKQRQNLFFSATMPSDIEKLAGELLKDPLKVSVAPPATTVERVNQQVAFIEAGRKRGLLMELFADPAFSRVLVFTRTKRGADKVTKILESGGVNASAIHGNKSQSQREKALAAFKAGQVRALVATDIAARGIDVSSVTHVVQYELPDVPDQYVHRIGRTARAGNNGSAIAFCAEDERSLLRDIEKVTRQKIPSVDRRNDTALATLSAAANVEGKRGERSDDYVDPRRRQQKRGRRPEQRNEPRSDQRRSDQPRAEPQRAEGGEAREGAGRSRRGRGRGGAPGRDGAAARNGQQPARQENGRQDNGRQQNARNENGRQPQREQAQRDGNGANNNRGQKSANHRKGQLRDKGKPMGGSGPTRGDVMKVLSGQPAGKVVAAGDLMKHLASANAWSKES
ncbi:MAG TPA: DEAD/DEAH box helicase, partial [Hyphomonadaceae bacterium]|nr:DEAD/DEAH box helicase [Hyphomonadaceae bacterium]